MPRKPNTVTPVEELPVNEAEVDRPLEQFVEHQRHAFVEASKAFTAMLPEEVREHGQAAVREMLEGYRMLFNNTLDTFIQTLEKARLETGEREKRKAEDGVMDESRKN